MSLLQRLGRVTGSPCAIRAQCDVGRPAPQLAGAHGRLGRHGGFISPDASRRSSPLACVGQSSVPLDAAAQLSTERLPAASSAAGAVAPDPGFVSAAAGEAPGAIPSETVEENAAAEARAASAAAFGEAGPSSSGSATSWPGRHDNRFSSSSSSTTTPPPKPPPPPYADAMTWQHSWPRSKPPKQRPSFLEPYPVPPGKIFNVNSFLGKRDIHGGQYLVPERRYRDFLAAYAEALDDGYALFLTENYHQRVYKYFLEFDWDWDTDLALVMEVTPQLVALATEVASEFYGVRYPNIITSIRTPYKIHLNFPQLLTTELLACMCRDRLLEACTTQLGPRYGNASASSSTAADGSGNAAGAGGGNSTGSTGAAVDWERLVDFPHGSLRLMGSRKAPHMDSDPAWVRDKAYHPARLTSDGRRWQPGRITPAILAASSIFPQQAQVAAFERSPAYLDLIFSDLEASQKRMEERRAERARRREERERQQLLQLQQQGADGSGVILPGSRGSRGSEIPNLPPGSSKNPLYVRLEVQPDESVALKIHIKSKFRHRDMQRFNSSRSGAPAPAPAEAAAGLGGVAESGTAAPPADDAAAVGETASAEAAVPVPGEAEAAEGAGTAVPTAAAADGDSGGSS